MLLDGSLFSVFRIVPTLKSAMENGSLCQVVLNKDFFQYGCNRVHLSSSLLIYSTMYIVMVVCSGADCHSKKTRPGANIFFFPSPSSVFLWYKEFHGTIQFRISFLRPQYRAQKSLPKKPEAAHTMFPNFFP